VIDHRDDTGTLDALQDCLTRIESGATPAEALAACPDAELRARIATLLAPALGLRDLPALPPERGVAIRANLDLLAAELYPAGDPPAPPATSLPSGQLPIRLITIAAIGVGLVLIAWSTLRSGQSPASDAGAPSSPVDARGASAGERFQSPLAPPATEPVPDSRNAGTAEAWRAADQVDRANIGAGDVVMPGDVGPPCSDLLGVEMGAGLGGTASAAVPQAGTAQVTGRVVDGDCHPVPDAIIVLTTSDGTSEFLARSESDGSYALAIPPGRYRAEVLADGYAIHGWFDGRSYHGVPAVDLRFGEPLAPDHLDFVLTGGPTGGFR